MSARQAPDRNIAMELVRVTEAGAMAAARWIGRGEKESADQAAVDAMRFVLDSDQQAFRLALSRATQIVIARALDLVGVSAPERM